MLPTKTKHFKTTALILLLIGLSLHSFGQITGTPGSPQPPLFKGENYSWGSAGLGIGTTDLVFNTHFAYQKNKHLFTANFNYNFKLSLSSNYSPDHTIELSLLYGRTYSNAWVKLSGSAGVGYVKQDLFIDEYYSDNGDTYDERSVSTAVGFPIQGEVIFPLYENIGFGFTGYANFNGIQSIAGVTLSVFVGKFP